MDIHVSSMLKIFMIMKKSKSARTSYWPDRICEKMHLKHFAGQWQGTLTLRPNQARLTDDTTPDFRVCRLAMGVYFDPLNQTRLFGNIYTYSWHILDNFGDIKHKAHVILEKKQLPIDNESIRQSVHNRETGSYSNWHQRNTLYMRDL